MEGQELKWRVVTYNVHSFNDAQFSASFPRLLQQLKQLQPDLLALNEAQHPCTPSLKEEDQVHALFQQLFQTTTTASRTSHKPNADVHQEDTYLSHIDKGLGLPHWAVGPAGCGLSNVLFSRWPLKRAEAISLDVGDYETRSLIVATVTLPPARAGEDGTDIDILATHLEHTDERARTEQIKLCLKHADPSRPLLLMGDLNAFIPEDYSFRHWQMIKSYFSRRFWVFPQPTVIAHLLDSGYIDCWRELRRSRPLQSALDANHGEQATTQTNPKPSARALDRITLLTEEDMEKCTVWTRNPLLRIDYIFCSPVFANRFELLNCRSVHECDASDHFPVLLDFRPRRPDPPLSSLNPESSLPPHAPLHEALSEQESEE